VSERDVWIKGRASDGGGGGRETVVYVPKLYNLRHSAGIVAAIKYGENSVDWDTNGRQYLVKNTHETTSYFQEHSSHTWGKMLKESLGNKT